MISAHHPASCPQASSSHWKVKTSPIPGPRQPWPPSSATLAPAGTIVTSPCVPGSRGFGFIGKPGCASSSLGCQQGPAKAECAVTSFGSKTQQEGWGFFQVLLRKSDLNTSALGKRPGLICLHRGTKEGTYSRIYILLHAMDLLPHSHGCQPQPCPGFPSAA